LSDTPNYDRLEATIAESDNSIDFWIQVYPPSPTEPALAPRQYHDSLSPEQLDDFWQTLQASEIGTLGDATANGPDPNNPNQLLFVSDAPTYQFQIQDVDQQLNHQFQVYGPRHVADERYQEIVQAFHQLVQETFNQEINTL
jgi:hypothetical protein